MNPLITGNVAIDAKGCWIWQGSKTRGGYGQVSYKGKILRVHRLSYELAKGSISEGLVIDHLCRVPACVNPDHLEAVTQRENLLRGDTWVAANVAKTHCPQGHPYDGPNLYVSPQGLRRCRACARKRSWKKKAA